VRRPRPAARALRCGAPREPQVHYSSVRERERKAGSDESHKRCQSGPPKLQCRRRQIHFRFQPVLVLGLLQEN
jgi:hypothetical protein